MRDPYKELVLDFARWSEKYPTGSQRWATSARVINEAYRQLIDLENRARHLAALGDTENSHLNERLIRRDPFLSLFQQDQIDSFHAPSKGS